jgi:tol-pal system protein YbgF
MQNRLICASTVLAIIALAIPPAAAQSREQRQMMASLQILQEQAQQLANTVSSLQQSLDEAVKALGGRVEDANATQRKAFADQKLLIDGVAADVRVVRERSDDNNVRITALREELEALRTAVLAIQAAQLAPPTPAPVPGPDGTPLPETAPPTSAAATPPAAAPVPVPSPAPPPPASAAGLSPTRMLDTAKADYFTGQWSSAINGFEAFLRAFPRSESAGEAQFYIGETYSAQGRWRDAVAAYATVGQSYSTSPLVPDAYYKQGLAYERLGQPDSARMAWEMVVKAYPDADAGRLAKQNLDRLGARRP